MLMAPLIAGAGWRDDARGEPHDADAVLRQRIGGAPTDGPLAARGHGDSGRRCEGLTRYVNAPAPASSQSA